MLLWLSAVSDSVFTCRYLLANSSRFEFTSFGVTAGCIISSCIALFSVFDDSISTHICRFNISCSRFCVILGYTITLYVHEWVALVLLTLKTCAYFGKAGANSRNGTWTKVIGWYIGSRIHDISAPCITLSGAEWAAITGDSWTWTGGRRAIVYGSKSMPNLMRHNFPFITN